MDKGALMFMSGLTLTLGGLAAASPVDEIAVAALTGGLGIAAAPVQAPVTAAGGALAVAVGLGLIAASMFVSDK